MGGGIPDLPTLFDGLCDLGGGGGGVGDTDTGPQIWSPMTEISTLMPQLEHLIVGNKPVSIVVVISDYRSRSHEK